MIAFYGNHRTTFRGRPVEIPTGTTEKFTKPFFADTQDPVFDGPKDRAKKVIPPLANINTEADE